MDPIIHTIAQYIQAHNLLAHGSPVIVGLSGGADSVALTAILAQLGYDIVACHCNFMLRGDESTRDRNHAAAVAHRLGVTFCETTFDTTGYAHLHNISIEMAARQLRYDWFAQMRTSHAAQAIAVAHHRDDNVETLLLNLSRGTGIAGLTGMKPRNGYIVRPLLGITRADILAFLQRNNLTYVNDSTNAETLYTRNKIRLQLLPLLRTINPAADTAIERTMAHLQECEKIYRHAVHTLADGISALTGDTLTINIQRWLSTPSPQAMLFELLSPRGFNTAQLGDIAACATARKAGKTFTSTTHRLVCDRGNIIVTPLPTAPQCDIVGTWQQGDANSIAGISISYHHAATFTIPRDPCHACFDADRLQYPLTLRHWRKGDTFIPFGMKGRQKVSDYFSDHKLSLIEKEKALILCDSTHILWIVGHRAADTARITPRTKNIIMFSCNNAEHK